MSESQSWFVDDGIVPLEVEGFGTLDAKSDLTHAERKRIANASLTQYKGDGNFDIDMARFDTERICAWVVGWSATDKEGKRVPFTRAAVQALSEPAFRAIDAALDRHVAAIEAARGKVTSNGHASSPSKAAGPSARTSRPAS